MKNKIIILGCGALLLGLSTLPHAARAETVTPAKETVAENPAALHVADEDADDGLIDFDKYLSPKTDEAMYNAAIARNPLDANAYAGRGEFFRTYGEYPKALADFQKTVALDPKDARAYMKLGQTLRALNRTDEAVAAFTKVHEVDAESPLPLYAIGLTYLRAKQWDKALEVFNQKLTLDKDNCTVLVKRGQTLFELKKYSAALTDLDAALKVDEENGRFDYARLLFGVSSKTLSQAHFYRSLILARKLDLVSKDDTFAPVIAEAKLAVETDAELADEYLKRTAPMLLDANQKYSARGLLSGAAAAQPKNTGVLLQLAEAQRLTFRSEESIKTYSQIFGLEPDTPTKLAAFRGRAATYAYNSAPYDAAKWKLAAQDLLQVFFADPEDAATVLSLTDAYYNARQNEQGLTIIGDLLKAQPDNAYAHMMRGLGLALKNDKAGAMAEVKTWLPKLTDAETDQAKHAFGAASGAYPDNAVLDAAYELIPEKEEDNNAGFLF